MIKKSCLVCGKLCFGVRCRACGYKDSTRNKKISLGRKGKGSWNKGLTKKDHPSIQSISNTLKKGYKEKDMNCGFKKGELNINNTKEWQEKSRKRMLENNPMKGIKSENHPLWMGGISKLPYGFEFDNKLKLKIRARDKFTCQECGYTEEQLGYVLPVHHIDYDKNNNEEINLICLCRSCHTQTNFGRVDWEIYYKNKIKGVA